MSFQKQEIFHQQPTILPAWRLVDSDLATVLLQTERTIPGLGQIAPPPCSLNTCKLNVQTTIASRFLTACTDDTPLPAKGAPLRPPLHLHKLSRSRHRRTMLPHQTGHSSSPADLNWHEQLLRASVHHCASQQTAGSPAAGPSQAEPAELPRSAPACNKDNINTYETTPLDWDISMPLCVFYQTKDGREAASILCLIMISSTSRFQAQGLMHITTFYRNRSSVVAQDVLG